MKKIALLFLSQLLVFSFLLSCRENITDPKEEEIKETPLVLSLKEIQTPSEKVIWKTGEIHEIEWAITKDLDKIRIVLLKKFVEVAVLEEMTENDGAYTWHIPDELPGSHHYRIKLISPYVMSASSTSVEFEIKKSSPVPE